MPSKFADPGTREHSVERVCTKTCIHGTADQTEGNGGTTAEGLFRGEWGAYLECRQWLLQERLTRLKGFYPMV